MKSIAYSQMLLMVALLNTLATQADESKPTLPRATKKPTSTFSVTTSARKQPDPTNKKASATQADTDSPTTQGPAPAEIVQLEQAQVKSALDDLRVKPTVADKIVKDVANPATSKDARGRITEIAGAAADLDLVAASQKVRDAVVDAVSRSDDPKSTADQKVGEAAIDQVFGKEVSKLVPAGKVGRGVFTTLVGISAALQNLGGNADDQEVVDTIKEGAQLGVNTPEAARTVLEKGAHKVLDKQGFTASKPGETLNDRLTRAVEEQKKLQAELDAKKAADAAKAAAKARATTAAQQSARAKSGAIGKTGIGQGAAGSTNVGRSVSSKVKVALGGGNGTTSGAGTAKIGTGTDARKSTGIGGENRMDQASSRLAAGSGGNSIAGQQTSGFEPTTQPGTQDAAPAATDSVPAAAAQTDARNDAAATATIDAPVPNNSTPVDQAGAASPSAESGGAAPSASNSSVTTGDFLIGSPGHQDTPGFKHYDTGNPNVGVDINYAQDGSYTGVVTVVTRDTAGNIVSITETPITGTWGYDASGQPRPATQTMGETTDATPGQSTANNDSQQSTENNDSQQDSSDDDKDDKDDDDKNAEDPPPAEETASDDANTETTTEESKEASTTPNPMDIGGGDPTQLASRTGGRVGTQEARRQQRGLDLARFGGAAGPNPDGKGGVPTLLTSEEKANAERALSMRKGAGITNPNPMGRGSVVATDRDLKEMHLRGNGGAKGPSDDTPPTKPQDPRSPLGGKPPGLAPSGGTRINGARSKTATLNRQLSVDRRIAQDALQAIIRN